MLHYARIWDMVKINNFYGQNICSVELLYEEGTELCYRVAGIIDTFANSENKLLRK